MVVLFQDFVAQLPAEAQHGGHHQERLDRGPIRLTPGSVEGCLSKEGPGAVVHATDGGADIGHVEDQRRLGVRRSRHGHVHRFRKCSGTSI